MKVETARVNGASYNNSLAVYNNQELRYNLDGKYRTFSGDVSVADNDPDKEAIFRIYVDGNLKYVSPKVKTGQIEHFSVNVSNGSELVMKVEDQNHDTNTRQSCLWLSPYLLEGNKALDESELYENLALNKPAEASSSVDDTTPTLANDGTDTTIWRGEEVHEGEEARPQEWIVDLQDHYDVRNARLGLEHDSIAYSYEIWTSPDKENWTKQITNTKSSQASNVLDYFTAKDVRYVKVVFTEVGEHADREQFSNAAISEFEIYQDKGVESVSEFSLKKLYIENKDLVFDPATSEYSIDLEGFETELRIHAAAMDDLASVSINGQSVPEDGTVTLKELKDNTINIEVTAQNGAVKNYVVRVNGTLGSLTNSSAGKIRDGFQKDGWFMEQQVSGTISTLTGDPFYVKNAEYAIMGAENWLRTGPRYMHPGNNGDAVRTFVAPKDGTINASLWSRKYADQPGDVRLKIMKNGEKIWPASSDWQNLKSGNTVEDSLLIEVKADDRIQFVVNANGSNGGDGTYLDAGICYLNDLDFETASIAGADRIKVINDVDASAQYAFSIHGVSDKTTLPITWSLEEEAAGVSMDENGKLSVKGTVPAGTITIKATADWDSSLVLRKEIRITRHTVEETGTYISDLEWEPESTPTGWGVAGKDKILSSDGSSTRKLSLPDENGQRVYYDKGLGVNSYSEIIYDVKGKGYDRFESWVGIDYEKYGNGEASVNFEVYRDGEKIYDSGNMGSRTPKKFVSLDIAGASSIKLVATMGDDDYEGNDNADWADAKFITCTDKTLYAISGTVDTFDTTLESAEGLEVKLYAAEDAEKTTPVASGTTNEEGNFILEPGVTTGNYVLVIEPAEGMYEGLTREITIVDDAVMLSDLVLTGIHTSDKSALQAVVEEAEKLDLSQYTEESAEALRTALADANEILAQENPEQEAIDEALAGLQTAMDNLEKLPANANKTLLIQAVDYAHQLVENGALENLNEIVKAEFNSALPEAEGLLEDESALQDQINASWKRLTRAIHMIDWTSSKSDLQALVDLYSALDQDKYEDGEAKDEFNNALAYARDVLADEAALDAVSIKTATERLQNAAAALVEKTPVEEFDTTMLEMLVGIVSEIDRDTYLSDGLEAFDAALEAAQNELADPTSQEAVDAAAMNLNAAWMNLRLKADESLLEGLRAFQSRVKVMNRALFSAAQLNQIDAAVQKVDALLNQDEVSKADAEALSTELKPVLQMMQDVEENQKPETNEKAEKPQEKTSISGSDKKKTTEKNEKADTAKSVKTAVSLLGSVELSLAAAGAALLGLLRRKKK